MKIGIPHSLLYYYYFPFWEELFTDLGQEVVVSEPNNERIMNKGVKYSISEICVPMKTFIGQVLELAEQDVDRIYVPRIKSIQKDVTLCPKFLGLPDMIRNSLDGMEDLLLVNTIEQNSDDISKVKDYEVFKEELDVSQQELEQALDNASERWQEYRSMHKQGFTSDILLSEQERSLETGDLTIGLLGYVYNIYDKFVNMDLLGKLRDMNVNVVTFEMIDDEVIQQEVAQMDKKMFWEFTNKLLGAGYHFLKSDEIDGIIHVTAFGCGPDSILGPFLDIDSDKYNKPFMTLRIDEQTGESHLVTRVEAFIDLLRLKNKKQARSQKQQDNEESEIA